MQIKSLRQRGAVFCMCCVLSLLAFGRLYRFDNKYTMGITPAQDGGRALTQAIVAGGKPVYLVDGWEIFPDQLLTWAQAETGVPAYIGQYPTWASFHRDASPYGQATYSLRLDWAGAPTQVSLYLPEIFSACRVYVNGALVGASGELEPYAPLVQDLTVSFPLSGPTELFIQTANYSHYYSGMTYPPALGLPQEISSMIAQRTALYGFLCFGSLAVALYSLAAWLGERRKQLSLWLAGLTLSFAVRISYPLWLLAGVRRVSLTYALEDAAAMAGIWFAVRMALELWGKENAPWARVFGKFSFGMVLVAVLIPIAILPRLPAFTPVYGLIISVWKLLSALVLCAAAMGGLRWGGMWMACGAGVYAAGLLLGVLTINRFEPARGAWPDEWGSFALVLCFAGLMVRRELELTWENRRLNENLQKEVERQTAQITGLVEERQRLLAEFLHDLKSPLVSVMSYARLVREHNILLDGQTRERLNIIEEKSGALARQLHMMQQFNAENPVVGSWANANLAQLLEQFYHSNRPDVEANGLQLRLQMTKAPCFARIDGEKLHRALQNLLFNALSFTPEDGVITLGLERRDDRAYLTVEDTGCGIAHHIQDQVFRRGFTTRPEDGGEGLGLYIVQTVAREHGGGVTVRSNPGQGTCFTLWLPLLREGEGKAP